jgi:hypothetical protein
VWIVRSSSWLHGSTAAIVLACHALVLSAGIETASAQRRSRRAAPQTTDTAETDRARSLFAEGVELVAESRFEEAEARFRQALAIRDAPAIRYNLASVLYEQGEYPEAQVENERALAAENVPAAVQTAAGELRAHIAERAAYVRFELAGAATGGSISVDGYVLTQPGLEVPISPAAHTVLVTLRGEEVARRQLEVPTGEHRVITLGESAVTEETPGAGAGRSIDQEDWFWPVVAGGGVLVVTIVAVSVGVAATSGTEGPVEGNFTPGVIRW